MDALPTLVLATDMTPYLHLCSLDKIVGIMCDGVNNRILNRKISGLKPALPTA
jgi:hypothetical protein